MFSTSRIVWLAVTAAWCALLPLCILIWWRKTRRAKLLPALVGALVFMVFARGLEGALHYWALFSDNAVSRAIKGSVWLYVLYGALAAGVFEETGRFVAFRWIIGRKRFPGRDTAVTYGIGHGGIESLLFIGATFALCAVTAALQSGGDQEALLALTKGDAAALSTLLEQAGGFTPPMCLFAMLERVSAMLLHIGLSVCVFLAARDRTQRRHFLLAVALHALADTPAALYQRGVLPMWAAELLIAVFSLCVLYSARKCYLEKTDP